MNSIEDIFIIELTKDIIFIILKLIKKYPINNKTK